MNKGIFGFSNNENISTAERFIFTTSGQWVVPRAVNSITFLLLGGGGGAGSGASNLVSGVTGWAGGGGGGACAQWNIQKLWGFDVPEGTVFNIQIGAGGAGGAARLNGSGANGSAGGNTAVTVAGSTSGSASTTTDNTPPGPRQYFLIESGGGRGGAAGTTSAGGSRGNANPRVTQIGIAPLDQSNRSNHCTDGSLGTAASIPYRSCLFSGGAGGGGVSGAVQGPGGSVQFEQDAVLSARGPYVPKFGDFYIADTSTDVFGNTFTFSAGGSATHGQFDAVPFTQPDFFSPIVWAPFNIGGAGGGGRSGGAGGTGARGFWGGGGGGGGGSNGDWSGTGGAGGTGICVIYIE